VLPVALLAVAPAQAAPAFKKAPLPNP